MVLFFKGMFCFSFEKRYRIFFNMINPFVGLLALFLVAKFYSDFYEIKDDLLKDFQSFSFELNTNNAYDFFIKQTIVGPSRCGKSTLLSLLVGFLQKEGGDIFFNGSEEISSLDISYIRKKVVFVQQESTLFSISIEDNLRLDDKKISDSDIDESLDISVYWEIVKSVPCEKKGMILERGMNLSGGQRQRLSLARALCRKPKILF